MAVSKAHMEGDTQAKEPSLVDHFSPAGYFKHPLLDKDKESKKDFFRAANDDDENVLYLGKCGPGVCDKGSRITIRHKRNEPPSQEQIMAALERAMAKGWTQIYVCAGFPPLTSPDMHMAQYIQNMISSMGLEDKISCCMDEKEVNAWLESGAYGVEKYREKQERQAAKVQRKAELDDSENPASSDTGHEHGPAAPFSEAAHDDEPEGPDAEGAANDDELPLSHTPSHAGPLAPSSPAVA